ncbi:MULTISPECIES: hypothetical protein [Methylobacterium]|uniref:Ribosome modulation factor n=2 Tax=Pseudomonadota TaxID=1224 RepID=A0ABQ4SZP4_9HYPH|nr:MULTISPECIES: hypothetical protein [Methylobacterium]GBU18082.1 hypothetical protein AwMethylo_22970 [Methylobacterium sp.]GJE08685.1 hypothetical protein AOPFMNJM_4028 [Methylobacterium jeotgali]
MKGPTNGARSFLTELARHKGFVSRKHLPPVCSREQERARRECHRNGWAAWGRDLPCDPAGWAITDDGRAALSEPPNG